MKKDADANIRRGMKNAFFDRGFPDTETHLLKAELVAIAALLQDPGLRTTLGICEDVPHPHFPGFQIDSSASRGT